ncbi:MAG: DUF504 domain-containing protein [Deltaproteobacteria bacterium]|nr:DUF504 domain-containing protein [Deltaproteobacteria bacterium]
MSTSIRDILNRHKWHHGDLHTFRITVVHRGAPGEQRLIDGADVRDIGPKGISVADDFEDEESGDTWIPYHRFLVVSGPDGIVWSKEAP